MECPFKKSLTKERSNLMGNQLQRGLSNRHIQLIAIGGAIGTGLFLGAGQTISLTGPSILITYLVIGVILLVLLQSKKI